MHNSARPKKIEAAAPRRKQTHRNQSRVGLDIAPIFREIEIKMCGKSARLSQAMIFFGEYYFGLNTEIYYFGMNTGITRLWRALESRATFELASVSLLGAKALAGLTGGNRPVPRPATCQASSSLLLESSGALSMAVWRKRSSAGVSPWYLSKVDLRRPSLVASLCHSYILPSPRRHHNNHASTGSLDEIRTR